MTMQSGNGQGERPDVLHQLGAAYTLCSYCSTECPCCTGKTSKPYIQEESQISGFAMARLLAVETSICTSNDSIDRLNESS